MHRPNTRLRGWFIGQCPFPLMRCKGFFEDVQYPFFFYNCPVGGFLILACFSNAIWSGENFVLSRSTMYIRSSLWRHRSARILLLVFGWSSQVWYSPDLPRGDSSVFSARKSEIRCSSWKVNKKTDPEWFDMVTLGDPASSIKHTSDFCIDYPLACITLSRRLANDDAHLLLWNTAE